MLTRITRLRAIKIKINPGAKKREIEVKDISIIKETDKQYRIAPVDAGVYRNIIAKSELNKLLKVHLDEKCIEYIIFIPWIKYENSLDEETKEVIQRALSDIDVYITKRISNYTRMIKGIRKGLKNFNFV